MPRSEPRTACVDAAVIGGGPAGATAGRLLAEWGHTVVILARAPTGLPSRVESLPPSSLRLMWSLGVREAVDAAGFLRTSGNTVWWGAGEGRSERFPAAAAPGDAAWGYQALRSRLDAVLLGAAARGGARVQLGASVRRVDLEAAECALVEYAATQGEPASTRARFVLDCSGRAGAIARRLGLRRPEPGRRTLAVSALWQREGGFPVADDSHTLVETYEGGWVWSVPLATGRRQVTAMIDPDLTGDAAPGLETLYDAELGRTVQIRELLSGGVRCGAVWASDASLYAASEFAGPRFLLVGDAGSFADPLSSFGVKKALASAWLAAVVVHTCLRWPERAETALGFFSSRERRIHASGLQQSARYARQAAERHPTAFWESRARLATLAPASDFDEAVDEEGGAGPEVAAAFEALRASPSGCLRCADGVRIEPRPAIEEREVVLRDAVVGPAGDAVRYVRGVDTPALLRLLGAHPRVPDLFEAYIRDHAAVALPDFLRAVSVLLARGTLSIPG